MPFISSAGPPNGTGNGSGNVTGIENGIRVKPAPKCAQAGPSSLQMSRKPESPTDESEEMIAIPSTGLEFFEYRRRLFLAGLPIPITTAALTPSSSSSSSSESSSSTIRIPKYLPPPKPAPPREAVSSPAVKRLEQLLGDEGSEEMQDSWDRGVGQVAKHLHAGKKLARGMRLGLAIKVLKASWIQDGLWPVDSTGRPIKPPESPIIEGIDLFPTSGDQFQQQEHQGQALSRGQSQSQDRNQPQPRVDVNGSQAHKENGLLPISVLEMVEVESER
ncbi:hypothetical protein IAU59_006567 [Kwoniella sp. CBS 9459]